VKSIEIWCWPFRLHTTTVRGVHEGRLKVGKHLGARETDSVMDGHLAPRLVPGVVFRVCVRGENALT
jgi:hypothetical protein